MARVLIFDDEEPLLKLVAIYLLHSGHSILQCSSPESAIEQFKEAAGDIDLLVADVAAGNPRGVEVALELRAVTPQLKLLFVIGHSFAGWSADHAASFRELPAESVRVLQKPFSPLDLLIKVDELVGELPQDAPACAATV